MELKDNNIVETREYGLGTIVSWNGEPTMLILKTFSKYLTDYDKEGKHKSNSKLDIVKVYDGSGISMKDVFKPNFNVSSLPIIVDNKENKG